MTFGDPSQFAIESSITRAMPVANRFRASGFFVLHVGGRCYGVHQPDATLLDCSIGEVEDRIARRGKHVVPFVHESAGDIADAFRDAIYAPGQDERRFFGLSRSQFEDLFRKSCAVWAPDGDEAFDDGSYVLQFDAGDRVRIIALRSGLQRYHHDPATLRDIWIDADQFYGTLTTWRSAFAGAWRLTCEKQNA